MMPTTTQHTPVANSWSALLASESLVCVLTDSRGLIKALSVAAERLLGYASHELSGRLINSCLFDKYDVRQRARCISRQLNKAVSPGFSVLVSDLDKSHTAQLLTKSKKRVPLRYSVTAVDDAEAGYLFSGFCAEEMVGLGQEVAELQTKLAVANAKLAALSVTDEVTGLKHSRAFEERLEQEFHRTLRHQSPLTVMMLTWQGYQQSLQTQGVAASNATLKAIADAQLKDNRSTDFLAHLGGGVMAYVLPDTTTEGAMVKAKRLRKILWRLTVDTGPLDVRMGIAGTGNDSPAVHGVTQSGLLAQRAQTALQSALQTEQGFVAQYDELQSESSEELQDC